MKKKTIISEKEIKSFIFNNQMKNKFSNFNDIFLKIGIIILTLGIIFFNFLYTDILFICFKIIINYIYLYI